MNTIVQTTKQIGFFTIALTFALLANFAYGQWANPTATPPGANATAPINISSTYQIKSGDIGAFDLLAGNRMRSDQYCDLAGNNCVLKLQQRVELSCPVNSAIRAINADGSVDCQAVGTSGTSGPTCTTEYTSVTTRGCIESQPRCPSGWIKTGENNESASCQDEPRKITLCTRSVCS